MTTETKLRTKNITGKLALKGGDKNWVLKERDEEGLGETQMKLLRRLLRITKLDVKKESIFQGPSGCAETCSVNKTVPTKVATTITQNEHKQEN